MSDLGTIFHVKKNGTQYDAHAYTTLSECPEPNLKLMHKGQQAYVKLTNKGSGDVPCYVKTKAGGLYQVLAALLRGQIYVTKGTPPWYSSLWGDSGKVINIDESVSGQTIVTCKGVTNMSYMFYACKNLDSIDLSSFNTTNVTNMSGAFYNCNNIRLIDLSNTDISNATDFRYTFYECNNLTTIEGIINMKSCKYYDGMFLNCGKLTGVKIKNPPAGFDGAGLNSSQYTIVS